MTARTTYGQTIATATPATEQSTTVRITHQVSREMKEKKLYSLLVRELL